MVLSYSPDRALVCGQVLGLSAFTVPLLPEPLFSGRIIYAGRYTAQRGAETLEAGLGDLIAFCRPFIANPDLPQRIANGWPLNPVDPSSMYGGTEKGYSDYPTYAE